MANFIATIEDIANGQLTAKLSEELGELIEAVAETTKPGELNLKITIKFDAGMAQVGAEIKTKIPKHGVPSSLFYFGAEKGDQTLSREDPRQLSLKNIDEPKKPGKLISLDDTRPLGEKHPGRDKYTEPEPEPETNGNGAE